MLTVGQMTPEQKIGRVMCARRFKKQEDIDFTLELVKNQACGALMLPFNARTKELARLYRTAAEYPVIIVNDMETKFPLSAQRSVKHPRDKALSPPMLIPPLKRRRHFWT